MIIVRYADDFIVGFQREADARIGPIRASGDTPEKTGIPGWGTRDSNLD